MEAATPLRQPHVRTIGDRLAVDGLVVHDESAVRLVREREEAGDDPVRAVVDAIEIGARVLDREQAGANADFVRSEFDRTARDVETAFADRAKQVAEFKARTVEALRAASDQQAETLRGVEKRMADLQVELQALRDQRQKGEELEAERERGTAKGRTFEEAVYEAVAAIASGQGD